jgi:hypothetical protein
MSRQQKINDLVALENEISELKQFFEVLKREVTTAHPSRGLSFIKKVVNVSSRLLFVIKRSNTSVLEIKIPEQMVIEIAALTRMWIAELEERAELELKNN